MTDTRIQRTTLHDVNDHDKNEETYQVEILHFANGAKLGYRLEIAESGEVDFIPAETALVEALLEHEHGDQ